MVFYKLLENRYFSFIGGMEGGGGGVPRLIFSGQMAKPIGNEHKGKPSLCNLLKTEPSNGWHKLTTVELSAVMLLQKTIIEAATILT